MYKSARPSERILAAADKLFYEQGIRAVGVDSIAAEAGVSKRTLYNYYPTKDDLIAAYLTARFKHIAPSDAPASVGSWRRWRRMRQASPWRQVVVNSGEGVGGIEGSGERDARRSAGRAARGRGGSHSRPARPDYSRQIC